MANHRGLILVPTVALVLWTTGCIFSKQAGTNWQAPSFQPTASGTYLLGQIPDGGVADGIIPGSGESIRTRIRTELLKRGLDIRQSDSSELNALLEEARKSGVARVVYGRIPIWEDNATEWSGKRDHAGVSVELYDAETGKLLSSAERTAHGVRTPNECAPWLAETVIKALFGESTDTVQGPPC